MTTLYIFVSVFFGSLAICGGCFLIAKLMKVFSRGLDHKTGNSSIAFLAPPMLFISLTVAAGAVWIFHVAARK